MRIKTQKKVDSSQGMLVLGLFEEDKQYYNSVSKVLASEIADALKKKSFSKKFGQLYKTRVNGKRIVVIGLGKKKELTLERVRRLLGKTMGSATCAKDDSCSIQFIDHIKSNFDAELLGRATAEGLLLSTYAFTKYLSKESQEKKKSASTVVLQWNGAAGFGKGLKTGRIVAESANFVRDLVNEPAGVANSLFLEKAARKVAAGSSKIRMKVLNKPDMKRLGMGAILGVNAGSKNPPKMIFLEYRGASGKPTAIVGKGITFDSGGYHMKPANYINDMKTDMAGAAAVLGTLKSISELGLKKHVVAVMSIAENMVSSTAQHPQDIVKAYNGKTIEIGNTDAEGRLVLADALSYTDDKYKPEIMIDMATLTGACVVALGHYAAAVMGKDDKLLETLKKAGMAAGDRVWPMPFFEEYHDAMDGTFSDLNNISQKGKGYEAGSITAGVFLSKFVKNAKWAHIDIAGSAYWNITNEYITKGATGAGVRVLSYYFLQN
jgi:leucyl aminopeptidase